VGYDNDEVDGRILKFRESKTVEGKVNFHIVLDKTVFYPEGGGQIGDRGEIIVAQKKIKVINTFKEASEIIHITDILPDNLNSTVTLKINKKRRSYIESNHTSTHLLNQALRNILGNHVEQRGSMISDKMFRFDFSHQNKITDSELNNIENFIREKINQSIDIIDKREEDYNTAIKNGAIGLFTEKYEDKVRTVKFNDSYELCGGTHVKNTANILSFKIISEGSQAFGIRRIVATSNKEIIITENIKQEKIKEKANNDNLNKLQKKEIELQNKTKIHSYKEEITKSIRSVNEVKVYVGEIDLNPKSIKELCFSISEQIDNLFIILLSISNNKVFISCFLSKGLSVEKKLDASKIIKELSPLIDGSGGGQSFYATGGGTNIQGVNSVISKAEKIFNQL
jgi:alanyl-tRNA synthetase